MVHSLIIASPLSSDTWRHRQHAQCIAHGHFPIGYSLHYIPLSGLVSEIFSDKINTWWRHQCHKTWIKYQWGSYGRTI